MSNAEYYIASYICHRLEWGREFAFSNSRFLDNVLKGNETKKASVTQNNVNGGNNFQTHPSLDISICISNHISLQFIFW